MNMKGDTKSERILKEEIRRRTQREKGGYPKEDPERKSDSKRERRKKVNKTDDELPAPPLQNTHQALTCIYK